MTPEDVAEILGVNASSVRNVESGSSARPGVIEQIHLVFPPAIADEIKREFNTHRKAEKTPDEPTREEHRWICVVEPNGRPRDYVSLDDVTMWISGSEVAALFERLYPAIHDRDAGGDPSEPYGRTLTYSSLSPKTTTNTSRAGSSYLAGDETK